MGPEITPPPAIRKPYAEEARLWMNPHRRGEAEAEGKTWANDLIPAASSAFRHEARLPSFGNAKGLRAVVWNFPDPIPQQPAGCSARGPGHGQK